MGLFFDSLTFFDSFIDTINEKGFTEVLKEFTATIKPWTETQHIMANFFRIFKPEEDAMMAAMNKGFAEVNSRLDDIKGLLEDVIEAIDWTVMKIQFSALEQKIISLTTALRDAYQAPDSEAGRKKFLVQYHLTYENSGSLLYTSIIHDDWVFQKNILKAGMIYTKHTRASVQNLMKGLISLLMKAAALEIASDSFMGWETGIEVIWEDKLKECKEAMARTDEYLEDKWMELMAQEMDDLAKDNQGRSHSEFADVAYKFFSTKYYWQNWFVLSYDQLSTYKEHATRTTMTYSHLRFRWFGRNYLVATRRKDFDWDRSIAWKWLKDTECYRPKEFCVREPAS